MDDIGKNEDFIKLLQTKNIETIHSGETTLEEHIHYGNRRWSLNHE